MPRSWICADFGVFADRNPALLDKRLLARHYRSSTLAAGPARRGWVEPDLLPFPWFPSGQHGWLIDHPPPTAVRLTRATSTVAPPPGSRVEVSARSPFRIAGLGPAELNDG